MGMYTELVVSCNVKDTPDVIAALRFMLGEISDEPFSKEHPLFKTERWRFMLKSTSYYFVPRSVSLLEKDDISKVWCFINRSDLKNYTGEIEAFVDWLNPHIEAEPGYMIGYSRYEENHDPVILRKRG